LLQAFLNPTLTTKYGFVFIDTEGRFYNKKAREARAFLIKSGLDLIWTVSAFNAFHSHFAHGASQNYTQTKKEYDWN
jgi:hypothetical protein